LQSFPGDFTASENTWKQIVNQGSGGGVGRSSVGGNPGGHLSAFANLTTRELLKFSVPVAYLGNQSAAHGNALTFDFGTYEYSLSPVPAIFDYGVAILTSVPEPAAWFLLMAGIAVLVSKRRF
jgi:hypothetical protein